MGSNGTTQDTRASLEAKLAAQRDKQRQREEAEQLEALAREVELLELVERFETQLGKRGRAFEVIEDDGHGEGPIVVKLGDSVLQQAFEAAVQKSETLGPAEMHNYVAPCVAYPSAEKAAEIFNRRPLLRSRCANAIANLFGAKRGNEKGKF